ncbi:MAG: TIGR02584 family CRISPR-associated protein [Kurthia sp.]|nr:TIGR02584 family CRISPR-associated protein [Candidatus Kurthia equi]
MTGMTPQIITETLYALAVDSEKSDKWVPTEIHVLTTAKGKIQIRSRLFNDRIFEQFVKDFHLPNIKFDDSTVHVITRDGEELEDLKTLDDNELAANETCRLIKLFTDEENSTVHVSIAGGRKTMGFYAGYALSLYGRAQDSMSHVLVSEEFEFAINFYYPTPYEHYVGKYNSQERLNAQHAKVFLANIPFVRLRNTLSTTHPLRMSNYQFSDVIEQLNQVNQTLSLEINVTQRYIKINDSIKAELPPREMALLMWFADYTIQGKAGLKAPTGSHKGEMSPAEQEYISQLTEEYLIQYDELKDGDTNIEVTKDFFDTTKSKLKKHLEKQLGNELAARIMPKQNGRSTPFYLPIEKEKIVITNNFKDRPI